MKGFVLYKGKSLADGAPIVVVASLKTSNRKTGDMVQTWILRDDMDPVSASKAMLDGSICGSCPHRQNVGGACYVNLGQAPLAVWRAYKRGVYPMFDPDLHSNFIRGRYVRLGAYGDPAMVPVHVWQNLVKLSAGHTGYTHQFGKKFFDPALLDLCMVSADSPKQAQKAQAQGGRTFRVAMAGDVAGDNEIECLADSKGMTCADCRLCNGQSRSGAPSVYITVHGSRSSKFKTATLIPLTQEA